VQKNDRAEFTQLEPQTRGPIDDRHEVAERCFMRWRLPRWIVRIFSGFGFAALLAIQLHGLWFAESNLPRTIFTSIYLFAIFVVAIGVDYGISSKDGP